MSTDIRAEISPSNDMWISKHRYYELKHYCLQYPEWKKRYAEIGYGERSTSIASVQNDGAGGDYVGGIAIARAELQRNITLIEDVAKEACPELYSYLLRAVTEDLPYTKMKTVMNVPCGKNYFYKAYRKFFYLLDKHRN